jgi:hypothetical protein
MREALGVPPFYLGWSIFLGSNDPILASRVVGKIGICHQAWAHIVLTIFWAQWLTTILSATWESEIRRIKAQGQPEKKIRDPISINGSWEWCLMPVVSATGRP